MKDRFVWYLALLTMALLGSAVLLMVVFHISGMPLWRSLARWSFYAGMMLPLTLLAVGLGLCLWSDRKRTR